MNTSTEIRSALKAAGYKARAISVRKTGGGSVQVTIKDPAIEIAGVKAIAEKFRQVDYCEATGEILAGGNTFVFCDYSREASDARKASTESLGDEIADSRAAIAAEARRQLAELGWA